ncbi:MAG: hypothetical protein C4288_12895 [Leptolyngbya sp. ERB_1_1]
MLAKTLCSKSFQPTPVLPLHKARHQRQATLLQVVRFQEVRLLALLPIRRMSHRAILLLAQQHPAQQHLAQHQQHQKQHHQYHQTQHQLQQLPTQHQRLPAQHQQYQKQHH